MPSSWRALVVFLLCFAPGWLAIAGWRRGRSVPGPDRALAGGVPAVVLSTAWTGLVALLAEPAAVQSWVRASAMGRAALLLTGFAMLYGVPTLLGYVAARLTRPTASEPVWTTAWLADGMVVHARSRPQRTAAGGWMFEDAVVVRGGERWRCGRVHVPDDRLILVSAARPSQR
jgi:hypothetical protein